MGNAKSCGGFRKDAAPPPEKRDSYATVVAFEEGRRVFNPHSKQNATGQFGAAALWAQAALIFCLFFTDYTFTAHTVFSYTTAYNVYCGMGMLMMVGFGYWRIFLKFYGLGAVGFNFLITAVGLQWALLVEGWMRSQSFSLEVDISCLLRATLAVVAVLVSYGPLVGKISPLQVLVLTVVELVFYCGNKVYFLESTTLQPFLDAGGTITVHLFGAYFGLAASLVYGPAEVWYDRDNGVSVPPEVGLGSSYLSDLYSLLGVCVLWVLFPCSVAASLPMGSAMQKLAVMNTIFALAGSTVMAFAVTTLPMQRLRLAPIRSASLAGGVAIGAVANLVPVTPGGALAVGAGAGALACGVALVSTRAGPYDPCGVHALHGVPALFGGLVSVSLPLFLRSEDLPTSWVHQLIGLSGTLVLAGVAGATMGGLLKFFERPLPPFHDDTFWETEHVDGWPTGQ